MASRAAAMSKRRADAMRRIEAAVAFERQSAEQYKYFTAVE